MFYCNGLMMESFLYIVNEYNNNNNKIFTKYKATIVRTTIDNLEDFPINYKCAPISTLSSHLLIFRIKYEEYNK